MNKIKKINTWLNQWDNQKQWYQCTFYASAQNLSYNCWITLTEEDLDIIAKEQEALWLFSYTQWAYALHSTNAILKYVKRKWFKVPQLLQLVNDYDVEQFLKNGYMVMTWINVNKKFKEDILDWKIDTIDYKDLVWTDLKHFLNIVDYKWVTKLVDNYWNNWTKKNVYECNLRELLEDIGQRTKFIFIY